MDIKEDYVSFEIAKLLKEKGFNEGCRAHYGTSGSFSYEKYEVEAAGCEMHNAILAPTLQMAMKWLRETKDWHIVLTPMFANDINHKMVLYGYDWEISSPSREQTEHSKDFLSNYEKSCEDAIKYSIENLI